MFDGKNADMRRWKNIGTNAQKKFFFVEDSRKQIWRVAETSSQFKFH